MALTLDAEDQPHLQRAKRLAQTAVLLAPEGDGGLQDLLAEINAIRAVWEEERGASPTANMLWNAAFDYVGGGGRTWPSRYSSACTRPACGDTKRGTTPWRQCYCAVPSCSPTGTSAASTRTR